MHRSATLTPIRRQAGSYSRHDPRRWSRCRSLPAGEPDSIHRTASWRRCGTSLRRPIDFQEIADRSPLLQLLPELPVHLLGQLTAPDLGVVADVHGQRFANDDVADAGGPVLVAQPFHHAGNQRCWALARFGFDDDQRPGPVRTDADQRAPVDAAHAVDDALDAFGEQHAIGRHDALGLPAAVPEPSLVVDAADIAHPVPDGAVGVAHLGQPGLRIALPVAVRDRGAGNADLADLAVFGRSAVFEALDGLVADPDHAHAIDLQRTTDADALP